MKNLIYLIAILIFSFQIASSQTSKIFSGNTDYVHAVEFSPGGKYIASGGYDGIIRIWDTESGDLVNSININNKIFKLYFGPDAKEVIVGTEPLNGISAADESFISVYDVFTGKKIEMPDIQSKSPNFFLPGYGDELISVAPELFLDSCKYIVDYNIEKDMEGKCYKFFLNYYTFSSNKFDNNVYIGMTGNWYFNYPVTISDDGKFLATYSILKDYEAENKLKPNRDNKDKNIEHSYKKNKLYIYDIEKKEMIVRTILIDNLPNQKNILLSNEGKYFIYTDKQYFNDVIKILDAEKDKDLRALTGHTNEILCLAMHPNGNFIASGSKDNTIRIWNINTGKEIKILEGHSDNINYISFSPDGRYLASASDDKTVRVWDLSTISEEMEMYALQYDINKGLKKYIIEAKNDELRKSGDNEVNRKNIDEKYSIRYKELYNKALEEFNKNVR